MIEYQIINVTLYMDEKQLNALGADGWELAHIIADTDGGPYTRYVFMRDREWARQHRGADTTVLVGA